jgi:hypothetical protein
MRNYTPQKFEIDDLDINNMRKQQYKGKAQ